ncbi:hypothetical protein DXG01_001703 [Tephrocybe rancida]|nr:hypothetical protein DXG01_001703 [Tephrocybe rancida]
MSIFSIAGALSWCAQAGSISTQVATQIYGFLIPLSILFTQLSRINPSSSTTSIPPTPTRTCPAPPTPTSSVPPELGFPWIPALVFLACFSLPIVQVVVTSLLSSPSPWLSGFSKRLRRIVVFLDVRNRLSGKPVFSAPISPGRALWALFYGIVIEEFTKEIVTLSGMSPASTTTPCTSILLGALVTLGILSPSYTKLLVIRTITLVIRTPARIAAPSYNGPVPVIIVTSPTVTSVSSASEYSEDSYHLEHTETEAIITTTTDDCISPTDQVQRWLEGVSGDDDEEERPGELLSRSASWSTVFSDANSDSASVDNADSSASLDEEQLVEFLADNTQDLDEAAPTVEQEQVHQILLDLERDNAGLVAGLNEEQVSEIDLDDEPATAQQEEQVPEVPVNSDSDLDEELVATQHEELHSEVDAIDCELANEPEDIEAPEDLAFITDTEAEEDISGSVRDESFYDQDGAHSEDAFDADVSRDEDCSALFKDIASPLVADDDLSSPQVPDIAAMELDGKDQQTQPEDNLDPADFSHEETPTTSSPISPSPSVSDYEPEHTSQTWESLADAQEALLMGQCSTIRGQPDLATELRSLALTDTRDDISSSPSSPPAPVSRPTAKPRSSLMGLLDAPAVGRRGSWR